MDGGAEWSSSGYVDLRKGRFRAKSRGSSVTRPKLIEPFPTSLFPTRPACHLRALRLPRARHPWAITLRATGEPIKRESKPLCSPANQESEPLVKGEIRP
ncbi:hypothetical protein E2C01_055716 [Portunus trituberculatus]|uniref:Uncharacterized protein n=1 Tax=Portunus trituberculatus TaxID=210409 RepID=A0A5B7GS11_PORTR|nr:hypothetical protein [Portunus trituberculatus]